MPKAVKIETARIVYDPRDSRRDRRIPLWQAEAAFARGELVQLDMGDAHPHSYMPAECVESFQ